MALLKILQASDIHETSNKTLDKYQYIRDAANQNKVDAVILNGDLFYKQESHRVMRVQHESMERLMGWVNSKDRSLLELHQQVEILGGPRGLLETINSPELEDEDVRKAYTKLLKKYEMKYEQIKVAIERNSTAINYSDKLVKKEIAKLKPEIDKQTEKRFKRLDKILGQIKAPVYFVRGNWETDNFYDFKWKNAKILEKEGVVDIKGVKFAGAPNWYERLSDMPKEFYEKMEKDIPWGGHTGAFEQLLEAEGTAEEKEQWENGTVPSSFAQRTAPFQRLKDKQFDVLVTHKGPHNLATERAKRMHYDSGIGLEALVRHVARPKVILGGHIHGKGLTLRQPVYEDYSYQGVRSSDEVFYVLDIDTDSKQIVPNGILPYKWKDHEKVVYDKAA